MHGMSLHQVRAEQEATGGSGALRSVHEHPDPRDAGGVLQTRCEDEQQDGDGGRGGANPCGALQLDPVLCAMGSIQSSIYGQVGGVAPPVQEGGGPIPPSCTSGAVRYRNSPGANLNPRHRTIREDE